MIKDKDQSWLAFSIEMALLIALVLCVRYYVFQFFRVSGPSMCPTLNELNDECEHGKGEFIFVNQFLYKFLAEPQRGEIVVFRPPNNKVYYVKRVIGLPGDTITVKKGKVYLSNEEFENFPLPETYLSAKNQGRTYSQIDEFIVPEGHYLLMGDNRAESLDARQCFGSCYNERTPFVETDKIKGRAEFVIWPFWTTRWMKNELSQLSGQASQG